MGGMTDAAFYSQLLCSASSAAVEACWLSLPFEDSRPAPMGFLARAWTWLRLLWTGGAAQAEGVVRARVPARRRALIRRARRRLPLSRRANPLAFVLARRFGRARYLRFLYDESLTGRVRWCFTAWNWKWAPRADYKNSPQPRAAKCALPFRAPLAPQSKLFPD